MRSSLVPRRFACPMLDNFGNVVFKLPTLSLGNDFQEVASTDMQLEKLP